MEALYLLVPLSLGIVGLATWIFFGASDSGQFEDLDAPALRVVLDDDGPAAPQPVGAQPATPEADN